MNEFKKFLDKISYTVRFHRVQKNLTQREVANGCDLGFRTYQRIESGEVFPRLDTLLCIAKFLKIPFPITGQPPAPHQLGVLGFDQETASLPEKAPKDWAQMDLGLRPLAESILRPHLKETVAKSDFLPFRLTSNTCDLSPQLQAYIGSTRESICLDDYIQGVRPVEIWELTHRLNAKVVLTKHAYKFPTMGPMCVLAVSFILRSAPEFAEAIGYMVDISSPEEFSRILSSIHDNPPPADLP